MAETVIALTRDRYRAPPLKIKFHGSDILSESGCHVRAGDDKWIDNLFLNSSIYILGAVL